ncbi:MAG TPA: hypothetical protein DGD08_13750 [Gemmatimonas aurantiaca]|uniref:Uncharacterized protein n=2 Tax=Gemmatimonas aurantiaca TaxID=173480 RepID=C1AAD0_GEMAT|nr:hypothetical protein [Gemmatimonas aurantiaca]BAH39728.1 hypothetical protein GAU_2686 [Gemmatimonas aurantiaca T-27]HCT58262.1 hypothetical protein [Gemmatimonas aurantiaca]
MRYVLDLQDDGPVLHCQDAEQAAWLGSLWLTAKQTWERPFLDQVAMGIRNMIGQAPPQVPRDMP